LWRCKSRNNTVIHWKSRLNHFNQQIDESVSSPNNLNNLILPALSYNSIIIQHPQAGTIHHSLKLRVFLCQLYKRALVNLVILYFSLFLYDQLPGENWFYWPICCILRCWIRKYGTFMATFLLKYWELFALICLKSWG
jgi:hypothetical protein